MRRKVSCAILCSAAMLTSLMVGSVSMAREEAKWIAVRQDEEDAAWEELAMTHDEVLTGVNVREAADVESEVVGILYPGCAVWIVEKGDTWTEISSGEIEGFVDNDYLIYGDEAKEISGEFGVLGVTAIWDGVSVFASPSGDAEIIGELKTGDDLVLLEDNGHWLTVEFGEGSAYVSEEDVQKALLLDAAYGLDEEYDGFETEEYEEEEYVETEAPQTEAPTYTPPQTEAPTYTPPQTEAPTYTPPQTEAPQTEAPQTEAPQTEAPQTEAPQTEAPQTEAPAQTEAPQTEAPTQTEETDTYYEDPGDSGTEIDPGEGGYFDADTQKYYDANGNEISGN